MFAIGIIIAALLAVGTSWGDHRIVRKCHRGTLTCWSPYALFAITSLAWTWFFFTHLD